MVFIRKIQTAARLFRESGLRGVVGVLKANYCRPFSIADNKIYKDRKPSTWGDMDVSSRFSFIYETNAWGSKDSVSGSGSSKAATRIYRHELEDFLTQGNFKSMFDAPCGDFYWMKEVVDRLELNYHGGDIVKSLIEKNRTEFGEDYEFTPLDIIRDEFPTSDVWHCRDCLFHLSNEHIYAALENFLRSDIQYALLTSHRPLFHKNLDIETGWFRYLDLEKAPFNFPKPVRYLRDYQYGKEVRRYVGVWTRQQIVEVVNNRRDF